MPGPLDRMLPDVLGGRTAAAFERAFGMRTVGDLLAHYPRRYAKRGELTALDTLTVGEDVTIVAEVRKVAERSMRQRKGNILEVEISDGSGILTLTFFNQAWRQKELVPGVRGIFAGKVGDYRGHRQLAHPDYELFHSGDARGTADPETLKQWVDEPVPIYPATSTVSSWVIASSVAVALDSLGDLEDPVPREVRLERGLVDLRVALEAIHRPTSFGDAHRARDALRFQEAFVLQSALLAQRAARRAEPAEPRLPGPLLAAFDASLPFRLTADQVRTGEEILRDLASPTPMSRLVQGEVGSGKTLVALRAMLAVADSGGQSALLAPTEVLAAQHLRSIVRILGPDVAARLRPTLLTGQLGAVERRKATLAAASGGAAIVIGTHALLGERIQFADLGLVVVDEQHRFGVEQREALRLKGRAPHVLVLTATPIPRTVAMTVFGDLDTSVIAELPAGRSPIVSHVVPLAERPGWAHRIWERVAEELAQGRQAFVVCPAIDDSKYELDAIDPEFEDAPVQRAAAVLSTLAALRQEPLLAGRRIEPLHGRMTADEKDATMRAFAAGDIDVLVATTVIEVGVDVPNASTMVVLDADRFGVSQLHQLRGRIGRGSVPGLALFVTEAQAETLARNRVEAVASTTDGFALADIDLELRREGDVLGRDQSGGRSSLKLLRVATDGELIQEARAAASAILDADPSLRTHPALRGAIVRRLDDEEAAFLAKG